MSGFSPASKALVGSYLRIFAAAVLAAYLNLKKAPVDLRLSDLTTLLNAGISSAVLTVVNFLRSGETRFGRGSQNVGMGHEDQLGPGGEVQIDGVEPVELSADPAVLQEYDEHGFLTDPPPTVER